jgi:hypothetical protein
MTLMSSKYSFQKITSKSIHLVQAIVRKTWDIRLVSAITESRKLKNLDEDFLESY